MTEKKINRKFAHLQNVYLNFSPTKTTKVKNEDIII